MTNPECFFLFHVIILELVLHDDFRQDIWTHWSIKQFVSVFVLSVRLSELIRELAKICLFRSNVNDSILHASISLLNDETNLCTLVHWFGLLLFIFATFNHITKNLKSWDKFVVFLICVMFIHLLNLCEKTLQLLVKFRKFFSSYNHLLAILCVSLEIFIAQVCIS